jgi:serine phosphatase RsbU (regulator of sigma subunit)
MFRKLWSWLINIGSQPNQSFAEKKKLRLMNATSVAGVLVCGSYLLLDALINTRLAPWIYFVGFINSLLIFYFNAKHLYTLAMYLFFIGNISIVTMLSIIFGEGLAAEHLMFLASINAVFFFDRSRYILPIFIFAVACFILIKFLQTGDPIYQSQYVGYVYYPNILLSFVTIYLVANLFKQEHINYESEIEAQKNEIEQQREELEKTYKQITDSLRYAKRIQLALLPEEKKIDDLFENFIFYKPKDIVSGDFYYFTEIDKFFIIAVVDCTGHGVPGAFMTMIGNALLNHIIKENQITEPAIILKELDKRLSETLQTQPDAHKINDGMDILLCRIDVDCQEITFAGAKRNLFIFQNNILREIKGNRFPIGSFQYKEKEFHQESFYYQKNDTMYLLTDGYTDQFGGQENKKLGSKYFKDLLLQFYLLPIHAQKTLFVKAFEDWRQHHTQTDDVLLVGVRL